MALPGRQKKILQSGKPVAAEIVESGLITVWKIGSRSSIVSLLELSLTVETKAKPNSRRDTRDQGAAARDRVENREWKFPTAWGKSPCRGEFSPTI
jgi:hypothetical protein